jgi:hypothetical protein
MFMMLNKYIMKTYFVMNLIIPIQYDKYYHFHLNLVK